MKVGTSIGIGGYLVGIGKIRADGSTTYHDLDTPKKNMVVDSGIALMLQMNFNNDVLSGDMDLWRALFTRVFNTGWTYSDQQRNGVLSYCAYGTSNAETTSDMTALDNKVSEYSSTLYSIDNSYAGLYGTYRRGNSMFFRVAFKFAATSQNYTVKEIGMFSRQKNGESSTNNFKMFSRIVLASPYELLSGEQFICCYELELAIPEVLHGIDTGLVDTLGNPIYMSRKYAFRSDGNNPGLPAFNFHPSFPNVQSEGSLNNGSGQYWYNPGITNVASAQNFYPIWAMTNTRDTVRPVIWYSTSPTKKFVADWATESGLTRATISMLFSLANYDATTKSRSCRLICTPQWPSGLGASDSVDITYMLYNGVAYRFGYYDAGYEGDEDHWHSQAIHKDGVHRLEMVYTQSYVPM